MATKTDVSLSKGKLRLDRYCIEWTEEQAVKIVNGILPLLGCMALDEVAKAVAILQAQQGDQQKVKP